MEHMDQHALSVPIGGGQTSNLLSQGTYVSLENHSPLGSLILLTSQLSHLCGEPLNLGVVIPLKLTSVITSLTKSTRHTSQDTFHSIEGLITANMALMAGLSLFCASAALISRDLPLACCHESVEGLPLGKTPTIAAANS
jgi:hypothetical protein